MPCAACRSVRSAGHKSAILAHQDAQFRPSRRTFVVNTVASVSAAHVLADDDMAKTCELPASDQAAAAGSIQARIDCAKKGAEVNLAGMIFPIGSDCSGISHW